MKPTDLLEIEALEAVAAPPAPSKPAPVPKSAPAAQPAATAPAKNRKSNRVVQTRAEADTLKLPILSSLTAVESYAHVPKPLLSELRKRNCAAFDPHGSGRVDVDALFRWLFQSGNIVWLFAEETKNGEIDLTKLSWKARSERAAAIIREVAAAKAQSESVSRDEVTATVGKAMASLFSAMEKSFGNTLPAALKGCSESEIQQRLLSSVEDFKAAFKAAITEFADKPSVDNQPKETK